MKYVLSLLFIFWATSPIYSQAEYVEKYDNGQIKIKGKVVDSILVGSYLENYETGVLKKEGELKNCEYETNHTKIAKITCGVGKNKNIVEGKRHGLWKEYYPSGILRLKSNYHCGIRQGNFFHYNENGTTFFIDFYIEDNLMGSQEFYENGQLKIVSTYSYEYSEDDDHNLKRTVETEYYEDGSLKIQRTIQELKEDIEKESFKEYYPNGFLKKESEIVDLDKNGIYREFYENGNTKYEGVFKDDKPIDKQYFFNPDGEVTKIETWKDGKIIDTEMKKDRG